MRAGLPAPRRPDVRWAYFSEELINVLVRVPGLKVTARTSAFHFKKKDTAVAEISKRWFGLRDTYAVDVAPDQDPALMIALTVAVDWMGHEEHDGDD